MKAAKKTTKKPGNGAKHTAGNTVEAAAPDGTIVMDRRASERRSDERRQRGEPMAGERRATERRKTPRRRQIDPTTCERDYGPDEIEFMAALDEYKRTSGRMFPTCSEILEVVKKLGYQKLTVAELAPPPVAPPVTESAAQSA